MCKIRKILSVFLLITITAGLLLGCNAENKKSFQSMEDFKQAKVGVLTGSTFDLLAREYFPEAKKLSYMNITDLILNLKQEKIDGILMDMGFFTPLMWEDESLSCIEMDMPATEYAVAFPKNEKSEPLKEQINAFIRAQTENGWLAELNAKWFSSSEPAEGPDFSQLSGKNGTLRVATTIESKPFDYLKDGHFCGFDADFIFRFAEEYGYALEFDTMDFGALLASISAGRYDLAISGITVTEERKESVLFSDTYCSSSIVMAIVADSNTADANQSLKDFATAKIGILTGSSHEETAKDIFPDATRVYFNNMADMILAVEQGKIDGYLEDAPFVAPLIWEGISLKLLDETVSQVKNGFVFPQGEGVQLREQINEFIDTAKSDGTIERLIEKWQGKTEPIEHPDYSKLTGENGTIKLAISVDNKPTLYQNAEGYTGFEMELLTLFGQRYGYKFDIEVVPFESIIAGISANKYDMGASALNITPEREESVDFSDPYAFFDVVMVVKGDNAAQAKMTLSDLENATLGIVTGTSWDLIAQKAYPNAERKYFTSDADALLALSQGKVDAFLADKTVYAGMRWENSGISCMDESIGEVSNALIFAKEGYNEKLLNQINAFIAKAQEDGTLDRLSEKWFADAEPQEHPDYMNLSGENGTLSIAICDAQKPVSYQKGSMYTGYEVDFLTLFAEEYGYKLDLQGMAFSALIPSVSSGKCDIGACGITITPERSESVTFTDPHFVTYGVAIIRNQSHDEQDTSRENIWDSMLESFEKTFIRENRWKQILQGIGVTLVISISSAVIGSLFGFGLYTLSRSDSKAIQMTAKGFAKVYSRIIAGTPVVVILMILFYVVFGKIRDMSGIAVAIIGFTLTFGAFVYDHMTVSVSSVDRGQTEAAYALGYTKNQTFFRIIFPQAMNIFLPSYCGQAVELIKATAVVGYIAVNDLTKMGDIIRSNTYEAFFPLIATAVIYFLLTWGLSLILQLVKLRFESKRRSAETILKGVKMK